MLVNIQDLAIVAGAKVPEELYAQILEKVEAYTDPIDTKKWVAQLITIFVHGYDVAATEAQHQAILALKAEHISQTNNVKNELLTNLEVAIKDLIVNAKPKDKPSIDGLERAIEIIQRSRI